MARALRINQENSFYHVLSRGNERRAIFYDEEDRKKFVELIGLCQSRYKVAIWSYVLMDNHYHLLLRPTQPNLSAAIQWLGLAYSRWFNVRHRRSGHLFQGRFKSFIILEEEYLYRLILYIHRNPLRAKMVRKLYEYPWSSYRKLGGYSSQPDWLMKEDILKMFAGNEPAFRHAVKTYEEEPDKLLDSLRCGILLGSQQAIEKLNNKIGKYVHREKPQTKEIKRQGPLQDVIREIAVRLNVPPGELNAFRTPIRGRGRIMRDILIYFLWKTTYYSLGEVGKYFNIEYTSVVNARKRGELHLNNHPKLKKLIETAK
jgi:putative transposase